MSEVASLKHKLHGFLSKAASLEFGDALLVMQPIEADSTILCLNQPHMNSVRL